MTTRIIHGDCIEAMAAMPEASVDAVATDPPYLISFMGKAFDSQHRNGNGAASEGKAMQDWHERWAREALRVLKPGGHLLAMGGTRTYHRLASGLEDAGFEIRDCLTYLHGQGFPKSLDAARAVRGDLAERWFRAPYGTPPADARWLTLDDAVPVVEAAAARVDGHGSALKPAHEPIVVARKPLSGTIAQTVLTHGTGALNIDGCRIAADWATDPTRRGWQGRKAPDNGMFGNGKARADYSQPNDDGRWPANVVLDEQAAVALDEQTGTLTSGREANGGHRRNGDKFRTAYGDFAGTEREPGVLYGDSGGASRFFPTFDHRHEDTERRVFYCAKASSAERNAGLDGSRLCTCNTFTEWVNADPPADTPAGTATPRTRATTAPCSADDSEWSTTGSGSKPTDPFPLASTSTIATRTSRTTPSTTSNSSTSSPTSGSTAPTTDGRVTTDGSDGAISAPSGNLQETSTSTSTLRAGSSTDDVAPATSRESSPPSSSASATACPDCGGVIKGARRNVHPLEPTVKPLALLRWMVRLVTPPGGTVLDPFLGSGTTLIAATLEGFDSIGIEQSAEYVAIAKARCAWWAKHPDGVTLVKRLEAEKERTAVEDAGQGALFDLGGRDGEASATRRYGDKGGTNFQVKPGRRRP